MKKITAIMIAAVAMASPSLADTPPEPPITAVDIDYGPSCEAHAITIYFANTDADLSLPALRTLEAKLQQIEDCAVTQIKTSAISADGASSTEMKALSEARTDRVLTSLATAGIWAPDIQTSIIVDADSAAADVHPEPLARRVEITLLTAPAIAS